MTAPEILTERLRLRAHRRADYADCCRLWQHPETVRFIGGTVQSDQAVWFRLLRYAGFWSLLGFGFWAIEDRATGAWLGEAGLMEAERGLDGLKGLPEVGWALMPEAGGKGIATEAVGAILAWADEALPAPRTACIVSPGNAPSLRVAAKLGYVEADRPLLDGAPTILHYRPKAA